MKLYEIDARYLEALDVLGSQLEAGEIDEQTYADTIESIAGEVEVKMLNVAKIIKTFEAEAGALKEVETSRAARRKSLENRIKSLKDYLAFEIQRTGIKPKDAEITIGTRKSEAVEIEDESLIPADYMREIPAYREPDKTLIKTAIKDGYTVPGARLVERQNAAIR